MRAEQPRHVTLIQRVRESKARDNKCRASYRLIVEKERTNGVNSEARRVIQSPCPSINTQIEVNSKQQTDINDRR